MILLRTKNFEKLFNTVKWKSQIGSSQLACTCSKWTMETQEKGVKIRSNLTIKTPEQHQ